MKKVISIVLAILLIVNSTLAYTTSVNAKGFGMIITSKPGNEVRIIPKTEDIKGWEVEEGNIEVVDNKFTSPEEDVKIKAIENEEYLLTVIFPYFTNSEKREAGENLTIEALSETGELVFKNWETSGITITEEQKNNPTLTFIMPENEVTITANYEEGISYPILATQDSWYTQGNTGIDKNKISSLVLSDSTAPTTYALSWDASESQDGSIIAYAVENEELEGDYIINIVGNNSGAIGANADSSNAFSGFTKVETISNIELLNTDNTTNMSNMFNGVGSNINTSILPSGYTQLEYIKSTGTQYINTGFLPNQDTRVVCDVVWEAPSESSSNYLFGARQSGSANKYAINGYGGKYEAHYNDNTTYMQSSISTRFILDKNKNVTTLNGESVTQTYTAFTCPVPMFLFAMNNNGTSYAASSATLYSCQVYDNDTLVRDFIPCKDSSGNIGLWDIVNSVFYSNSGTGTFTAGEEISTASEENLITLDLSTWNMSKVTNTTQMFNNCTSIAELTIPASLSIISNNFATGCTALETITFLHSESNTITMPMSGSSTGAFYVADYVETTINSNNSTILNYDWKSDNRELDIYTVIFNANGGEGSMASQTFTEGVSKNLTSNTFVKEGYNFLGWSISNTATTATYQDGQSYIATGNVTLYAVWEENWAGWNAPKLGTGLTPVNWNGSSWVTTDEANWDYNYEIATAGHGTVAGDGTGKWANAQTSDGSLYVWIPRYTYKITSGNHSSGNSWSSVGSSGTNKILVKFSKGTTDDTSSSYLKHPAFTFGSDELEGIWVAKYEASRNDATSSNSGSGTTVSSKPGVWAWTNLTVSDMYSYAYNLNRTLDSHLMRNSEWGAVAYLTNAIGKIPYINNSNSGITGNAGGSQDASSANGVTNAWNTANGVKASTTHNVYGIYDMSGGRYEYVSAYYTGGSSAYISNLTSNKGTKYVETYTTAYDSTKKGDAVYETSSSGEDNSSSWDGDFAWAPMSWAPVFIRGGYFADTSSAGIFAFSIFSDGDGCNDATIGFRAVLAIP